MSGKMTGEQPDALLPGYRQRKNMKLATLSASAGVIGLYCISGNVLNLVALKLGAGEVLLGLLSFLFFVPRIFSFFTMPTVELRGKKRVLLTWYSCSLVAVSVFLLVPAVAEHISYRFCLVMVMAAVLVQGTCESLGFPGWFPILQDSVPEAITGRFFARLRATWQTAGLVTLIFAAVLLGNNPQWWKFQLIFSIAFFAYLLRVLALIKMSENPPLSAEKVQPNPLTRLAEVWANKRLRSVLFYIVFYMFAVTITAPFKIKFMRDLGYSDGFILAATTMLAVGAIISLKFWGNLADRFGNRAIFSISHIGMICITLMWLMVQKSGFASVLLFALFFFQSVFNSGNGIAQTRYILHAVPRDKQNYITIINLFAVITAGISPLVGGFFLHLTRNLNFQTGAVQLDNYYLLFVISAVLFIVPHILRNRLKCKKEASTAVVLAIVSRPFYRDS